MKKLFDEVSAASSKSTTRTYSTSFSLGIYFLDRRFHQSIYGIYGFVRYADEIVDSFHDYDRKTLFEEFKDETYKAIDRKISLNPILNSFQHVVHNYGIDRNLIDSFLQSMETDLHQNVHSLSSFNQYIYGSSEAVGLMCLRIFTFGDDGLYNRLAPAAMKLGAAFQKVNFLRDAKADFEELGRSYFPGVDLRKLTVSEKRKIEADIKQDFEEALAGIRELPKGARKGVYIAYFYYIKLFRKIIEAPTEVLMSERIRISNANKLVLMLSSSVRHQLNLI